MKLRKKFKKIYEESDKKTLVVYIILRTLVLLIFIRQLFLGEISNALLCLFSLILFTIPFFIEKKFKITIPTFLEIIVLCIIFAAEILGEINNFYVRIPNFDTLLHTINGFLSAGIGFSLVDLLNKNSNKINLSPLFLSLVAFCFSMTIGVLWEFYEFGADMIFKTDMQKDTIIKEINTVELDTTKKTKVVNVKNIDKTIIYKDKGKNQLEIDGYLDIGLIDTMKDLMVNFLGSLTFSILGYLYVLNREKYKFVNNFILTKKIPIIKEEE